MRVRDRIQTRHRGRNMTASSDMGNTQTGDTQLSKAMNNPKRFIEVKGAPGQLVRGTIVPNFGGKTTVRIAGDRLHELAQIGSDRRETFTPLRAIDHVGVYESSIGVLLIVALILFGLGAFVLVSDALRLQNLALGFFVASVALAVFYFFVKYKYLVVYSPRNTIIVFFTKSPYPYRQFAITVLDSARELRQPKRRRRSSSSPPKPPQ